MLKAAQSKHLTSCPNNNFQFKNQITHQADNLKHVRNANRKQHLKKWDEPEKIIHFRWSCGEKTQISHPKMGNS